MSRKISWIFCFRLVSIRGSSHFSCFSLNGAIHVSTRSGTGLSAPVLSTALDQMDLFIRQHVYQIKQCVIVIFYLVNVNLLRLRLFLWIESILNCTQEIRHNVLGQSHLIDKWDIGFIPSDIELLWIQNSRHLTKWWPWNMCSTSGYHVHVSMSMARASPTQSVPLT